MLLLTGMTISRMKCVRRKWWPHLSMMISQLSFIQQETHCSESGARRIYWCVDMKRQIGMIVKIIKLRKRSLLSPTPCYFTAFQAYPTESINYILIANLLCFWKLTIPSRGCRKFGSCDVQQSKLIPQKITENLELQRQCQGLEKTPMHLPKGKIRQHSLI